jgi:hypothetical protein
MIFQELEYKMNLVFELPSERFIREGLSDKNDCKPNTSLVKMQGVFTSCE